MIILGCGYAHNNDDDDDDDKNSNNNNNNSNNNWKISIQLTNMGLSNAHHNYGCHAGGTDCRGCERAHLGSQTKGIFILLLDTCFVCNNGLYDLLHNHLKTCTYGLAKITQALSSTRKSLGMRLNVYQICIHLIFIFLACIYEWTFYWIRSILRRLRG